MYKGVIGVQPTDDFRLIIEFEGGEKRIFDMKPILSCGRFSELEDATAFRNVHVRFDTVQWGNGLDLDPEYLYHQSQSVTD